MAETTAIWWIFSGKYDRKVRVTIYWRVGIRRVEVSTFYLISRCGMWSLKLTKLWVRVQDWSSRRPMIAIRIIKK